MSDLDEFSHGLISNTQDIRDEIVFRFSRNDFVVDKTGVKMIEILGVPFICDSDVLFGEINWDYVNREIAWYESMSRNVNDIPGGPPAIWKEVATPEGLINSNYGWMIFSEDNGDQFINVVNELERNRFSRRAEMIYQRPSMWKDYNEGGRSDFCCTDSHQYFIRGCKLHALVRMRSNDAIFGFKNDYQWAKHVQEKLHFELLRTYPELEIGDIIWNSGSLHVYERHFYLLEHYYQTQETSIDLKTYKELYPDSPWSK